MSELQELIRKRGSLKGRLTNFEKYLAGYTDGTTCTEVQLIELKLRIDKINEIFSEFDHIQQSIEVSVEGDDDIALQESQRLDFETQFYRSVARAEALVQSNNKNRSFKRSGASSSSSAAGNEEEDTVMNAKSLKGVKLPTINIPKFSGDYSNWLEFRDTYVSMIHKNASITSIQKFHYLRAALDGSAIQIIHALEFSAANYTVAWGALCERYDNTRILVQNHIKSLFNEDSIKKESAESIRRLLDAYTKNLRALHILGEPTSSWDTLIIYIASSKLDFRTLREWEEHKIKHKHLTFDIFCKFLKNRADLLETIELGSNKNYQNNKNQNKFDKNKTFKALAANASNTDSSTTHKCPLCDEEHRIYTCQKFHQLSVSDRKQFAWKAKLCINCLRIGHHRNKCRSGPCKKCKLPHNTLLHRDDDSQSEFGSPSKTTVLSAINSQSGQVLLATALIYIRGANNVMHKVKAVLDSGSQASFMTEALMIKLGLPTQQTNFTVAGINNSVSSISKTCTTIIQSRLNNFQARISFLVLPQLTNSTNVIADIGALNIPNDIILADPEFLSPSSIDILLGADIFWDLLGNKQVRLNHKYPVLQETKFGYVVTGPTKGLQGTRLSSNYCQFDAIQDQLAKFWTIEEFPESRKSAYSVEEATCEEHFVQNVSRESDGRFSVAIPLKMSESELGDSYGRAKNCFLSLERRFQSQPILRGMYVDFMTEYEQLGHMSKGNVHDPHQTAYFLPHHGVLRDQSTTTKLRAVFNASAPTTSGLSLNDLQMVGPTIQSDLLSILLRFRQHRFVMAGDIEKMYRQVLIHKHQRHLQQIIWRCDPSKPLESYTLNTVTYGTASAPFLAVRCLKQLADECEDTQIRQIINEDFYVDDLLTGDSTPEGLMRIRSLVSEVLASGCFNLRKFRSNLPTCESPDSSDSSVVVDLSEHAQSSTLGLKWSPSSDELYFVIKESDDSIATKRKILSTISQVFDPLGLLSIFIITGKILLQKLWLHKLQWDDQLPQDVMKLWTKFINSITHIIQTSIN